MKIFLVGGAVRDKLLGYEGHDRDYVVLGADESVFLEKFPSAKKVGTRESVYVLKGAEYTLSKERNIEADLLRRDLTINAFAEDEAGRIIAHPLAKEDLQNRVLRPISEKNFLDDPLRVFRAARFAAQFPDFTLHVSLKPILAAVSRQGLLADISAERVGNEVRKACGAVSPSRFFQLLAETGTLAPWLQEMEAAKCVPAGPKPFHSGTVFDHTLTVMEQMRGRELRVWMGLCHDLGKTVTDPLLWPRHHGHESAGERLAGELGQRLRLPGKMLRAGEAAARFHMTAGRYGELRAATKVSLLLTLHRSRLVRDLFALVEADKRVDFRSRAEDDLAAILSVKLPEKFRGQGKKAGGILHRLRAEKLSAGAHRLHERKNDLPSDDIPTE